MKSKLVGWTVVVLQKIFRMDKLERFHEELRTLPEGSTGKAVANLLDKKQFKLIPKFSNHDLKHVVLDYDMRLEEEIRMQAYLIGNGNYTLPCLIILSAGIFYPKLWPSLLEHYKQGKESNSIFNLKLEECKAITIAEIKRQYGRRRT